MQSGQIRLNKVTKEWVIYAPSRRERPHDFQQKSREKQSSFLPPPDCPFCPANEHKLSSISLEIPSKHHEGWQTRVVPNKFPALTSNENTERSQDGIYVAMPGYGQHDVVIESPDHYQDIATMSTPEVETVVETYHKRYVELMQVHQNMMAIIFRNHGERAGASLTHPHSQIIVTGMVPQNVRWREQEVQRYYDLRGRCVYCDILEFERHHRRRVVQEHELFLAFVPFAADVPFEVWIMPKKHQADFGNISDLDKEGFALILKSVLTKLYEKLHDPDYNYVINTAPRYKADEPQVHWYCQIKPRLTTPAGFEMGSGINVNPSIPEADADFLNAE
ncbi:MULTISPECIES: galactose-1-phosphate uridylyltransferase [unclassified Coleofasciculus]|uniref:galactose-1-phosphate uridylyltransferase n=1 Tax=unclassified Coleofasciculus TaxID=2692782 RepID=UPI00187DE1CF|nr:MULTISPECIES: galactose-1-phosphate uridylyltransferase [unclassified Coleofasciculus]MBE9125827.1 galactose-1-phosphate uridylyltransferase [Coleofasciculus sp. LEGE 07081]MBE9148988.1 galactose-1-phosphate uridylyltransferase [Coleofasciculus sp. LEGE 07092]